jgi:hypothetical protein
VDYMAASQPVQVKVESDPERSDSHDDTLEFVEAVAARFSGRPNWILAATVLAPVAELTQIDCADALMQRRDSIWSTRPRSSGHRRRTRACASGWLVLARSWPPVARRAGTEGVARLDARGERGPERVCRAPSAHRSHVLNNFGPLFSSLFSIRNLGTSACWCRPPPTPSLIFGAAAQRSAKSGAEVIH